MATQGFSLKAWAGAAVLMLLTAFAGPAAAMTFAMDAAGDCAGRTCVIARGQIDPSSLQEFKTFVQRNHIEPGTVVVLDSGGGLASQGIELGAYIRRQGLSTHVQGLTGTCASACVFAFLGGVARTAGEGAKIGVHQLSQSAGAVSIGSSGTQAVLSQVAGHVVRMGASMDLLMLAVQIPPEQICWLSDPDLRRLRVVTQ